MHDDGTSRCCTLLLLITHIVMCRHKSSCSRSQSQTCLRCPGTRHTRTEHKHWPQGRSTTWLHTADRVLGPGADCTPHLKGQDGCSEWIVWLEEFLHGGWESSTHCNTRKHKQTKRKQINRMRSLFFLTCRLFSTFSFDSSGFGTDYLSLTLPVFDLHVVLYLQKSPQPIPDLQVLPDSTE